VPFVVTNTVPAAGANVAAGVFSTFDTVRLERIEPSIIDTFEEWVAYSQLSGTNALATGDIDNDGAKNLWEFFTGTDPLRSDTNQPAGLSIAYDTSTSMVEIGFMRARAALSQAFNLQYSTDLIGWSPSGLVTLGITPVDDRVDWLTLTLPAPDPNHAFFRLELPNP
jgi:hypothetical protein